MADKVFKEIEDVIADYTGLSRKVLEIALLMKNNMIASREPDYSPEIWERIEDYVSPDEFERIGIFKESMDYKKYIDFNAKWAPTADWEGSFKRVTECGHLVFLELEERVTAEGATNIVNTLMVYDFNSAGKVRHLDVYMQEAPKDAVHPAYA
ncbi:hypothetical protein [Novosphingobium album (ex Hu et al. 2023)]|uniref:SnoaL-like domain-containing protein n=1 Tax=Novosphingobium album (ex Hu et al. 2023) TaxID=2930093 RepID=A0ABT0B5D9_9SPHN|nr:hypothetical protein [Novosphingobium album (ex Hu et al. 2023)]MCJ2180259.1 hypothetical protein [Novosphingobium album (ex Hu et al. 2023)]